MFIPNLKVWANDSYVKDEDSHMKFSTLDWVTYETDFDRDLKLNHEEKVSSVSYTDGEYSIDLNNFILYDKLKYVHLNSAE